ncbi:MAG: hypothetical protein AAFO28_05770, partial [Pseudomonadota bacterium]
SGAHGLDVRCAPVLKPDNFRFHPEPKSDAMASHRKDIQAFVSTQTPHAGRRGFVRRRFSHVSGVDAPDRC